MPVYDIYQAMTPDVTDTNYYEAPPMSKFIMVGPGIVAPNTTTERMNGLGKKKRHVTAEEEDEDQTEIYLSAPKSMTKGKGCCKGMGKHGKGLYLAGSGGKGRRGKGLYLAGSGRDRMDQSGGAARVHGVAQKLLQKAYPAVFRGLGAALHHQSMYRMMHGSGMKGSGKVGAWFRKLGSSVKGAVKKAGAWAKEKLWQPLLERAKKLFGDFVREKLKQYIPDTEAGIQAKADELLDKAFSWIAGKLPPGWAQAAGAAFEVLRGPLRELASSAIKKGFEALHKVSATTGVNLNYDQPEPTDEPKADVAASEEASEVMEVPDGDSSGKGYGGHMFGGRRISSAQLSALTRAHVQNKFNKNPAMLAAMASY